MISRSSHLCGFQSLDFMKPAKDSVRNSESLLTPREAALQLRISFPTIKQWIYKKRIRSVRTRGHNEAVRQEVLRRISGRNQLVGRIEEVRISGLMAEVKISIGGQRITSIITASSAR